MMEVPKGNVILEFCSERCVACKTVDTIMKDLLKDYNDVELIKVDVHKNRDLARRYGVIALPVLIFLKNGKEVDRLKGAKTREELRDFIERNR